MSATMIRHDEEELKLLVQRHRVCWEVVPIWHVPRAGEMVKIGYELDLLGTHDHPKQPPMAGCNECHTVFSALQRIAQAILPSDRRPSRYVIEPYDVSIQFSPRRKMRADILVAIDIIHRDHFDRTVDACEIQCLNEMKERLKEIGVRPRAMVTVER